MLGKYYDEERSATIEEALLMWRDRPTRCPRCGKYTLYAEEIDEPGANVNLVWMECHNDDCDFRSIPL